MKHSAFPPSLSFTEENEQVTYHLVKIRRHTTGTMTCRYEAPIVNRENQRTCTSSKILNEAEIKRHVALQQNPAERKSRRPFFTRSSESPRVRFGLVHT